MEEILHQLIGIFYHMIYRVLYIPRGDRRISAINSQLPTSFINFTKHEEPTGGGHGFHAFRKKPHHSNNLQRDVVGCRNFSSCIWKAIPVRPNMLNNLEHLLGARSFSSILFISLRTEPSNSQVTVPYEDNPAVLKSHEPRKKNGVPDFPLNPGCLIGILTIVCQIIPRYLDSIMPYIP